MSGFEPGQYVRCVDDTPPPYEPKLLTRGLVYTITEVLDSAVTLAEVATPLGFYGFLARRFRPLPDERLNIFREMLAPKPEEVVAYEIADNIDRTEEVARAIGAWGA